jgi:hypothetical protein
MGVDGPGERSTICGEGCAMSCLSSGLAGLGATIEGASERPESPISSMSTLWNCTLLDIYA